jgi:chromosome segregation ATPase
LAVAQETVRPIVLPGIFTRWKLPGEADKPEISIEEIGRCMGAGQSVRELREFLTREGEPLERESGELKQQAAALKEAGDRIDVDKAALAESLRAFGVQNADLERRRAEIEKARKSAKAPSDAKALNELIARFNKDLEGLQRRKPQIDTVVASINERIVAFNASIVASNERVAAFNLQLGGYRAKADEFDRFLVGYKERCAGERRLVK